jgi:outer membrane protein assembly factor BamB
MTTLIAALSALATTATLNPTTDEDLTARQNRVHEVDASRYQVFGLHWRRPVVRTGVFRTVGTSFGAPVVSSKAGVVVVGNGAGDVTALSLKDGTQTWKYHHGAPFTASATIVTLSRGEDEEELVVLGSLDNMLVALEVMSGKVRWQAELDGNARAPARLVGTRLLVTTASNKLFLLDAHTGNRLWTRGRPSPTGLTVDGHAGAIAALGRVYATYADGYAESYKLEDGTLIWSRPLSISGGKFIDADADPVLADGKLLVASYADGIFALNPEDGQTLWSRTAPAVTSLAQYESLIVAASADGWLWGLNLADGKLVYRVRLAPGPMSRLTVRRQTLVLTAGVSGLLVLDAATGEPLQTYPVGSAFAGDVSWDGNNLAFLNSAGFVYALKLRSAPPATRR